MQEVTKFAMPRCVYGAALEEAPASGGLECLVGLRDMRATWLEQNEQRKDLEDELREGFRSDRRWPCKLL